MAIYLYNDTILVDSDAIAISEDCCCEMTCSTNCWASCSGDVRVTITGFTGNALATECNQTFDGSPESAPNCAWYTEYDDGGSLPPGVSDVTLFVDVYCYATDTTKWRVDYYFCNYGSLGYLYGGDTLYATVSSTCPQITFENVYFIDEGYPLDQSQTFNLSIQYQAP